MIRGILIVCASFFFALQVQAQQERYYWVEFIDKKGATYSLEEPLEFLSQRAIDRRNTQGLPLTETDLPVSNAYLDSLRKFGEIVHTSRWLNAATVKTTDSLFLQKIAGYTFIKNPSGLKKRAQGIKSTHINMLKASQTFSPQEYGKAYEQIAIHNGEQLHNTGYKGEGMYIGVLDAGFYKVDSLEAFSHLRDQNKILGTLDLVKDGKQVYTAHQHGLYVLSTMAAYKPGEIIGTAPEASYFLIRTEDDDSESPLEEANWVAGIEWADSAGVDVINSSLGYSRFDSSAFDHHTSELTGDIFIISRAASMAASKGMIVVNSAGNSGNGSWHYITAPADAKDILAVGAISTKRKVAGFSSRGPSADERVKPDVVSVGDDTYIIGPNDQLATADGTSLSSPVIAGLVACLWQTAPGKTSYEIMDAVRKSADLYAVPNDSLGYGIPDFSLAREILKGYPVGKSYIGEVYPNPFTNEIQLSYFTPTPQTVQVSLTDMLGRRVFITTDESGGSTLNRIVIEPGHLRTGIYLLAIHTREGVLSSKVLKK